MAIEDIPHFVDLPLTSRGTVTVQAVQQQPTGSAGDSGLHTDTHVYAVTNYTHVQAVPLHLHAFDPTVVTVVPVALLSAYVANKRHRDDTT